MASAWRGAIRWAQILLLFPLALIAVYLGQFAYKKLVTDRPRFEQDVDLMEELASAKFLDDTTGLDAKSWPQWRGPRRDGVTTASDLLTEWPAGGPKRLWRAEGGDGYSSFAVADGLAYCMIGVSDNEEAVVCWNVADGKERWRHSYAPRTTIQYGGPRATPTIDGKRLYTVSSTGTLMCLGTGDGKVIWERDLPQEVGAIMPRWGFAFSPLVESGRVFAIPGGNNGRCLAAFSAEDGKLLWTSQDDPAGYSSPIGATITGVRQVLFFTGRRLLGVTPDEGKLLWEFPWHTDFEVNAATPEVIRARSGEKDLTYVFISSNYGKGCALVKILGGGDTFGAQAVHESNALRCHFASPVRHGEYIYGLDEQRSLSCLSLRTGQVIWQKSGFAKGSLLRVDDRLIVLGEEGKLALIDASPDGYQELAAARPFRGKCWTAPVLAGGRLFLRDRKQVLCLDLRMR